MEEQALGLTDYLAILRRRKWQMAIPAVLILAVSIGLAFGLPSIYQSEATILIEQQEVPTDLVRSTVTSYAGERIQFISQSVMTTENLSRIIDEYGLYKQLREEMSMYSLVGALRDEIRMEMISADVVDPRSGRPTTATIAFKLSFADRDPRIAQKITNELVSLYLGANLKRRTESAIQTSGFLSAEAEKLKQVVIDLEVRLATFKEKNIYTLPELQQLNIQLMERTEREQQDIDQQIRSLEERIIYLESELVQIDPHTQALTVDGKRILGPQERLHILKTELIGYQAKYATDHPTIVRLNKEIHGLEAEISNNDEHLQLQAQLKVLELEKTTLKQRYAEEHPDMKKLQRRIDSTRNAIALAKSASESAVGSQDMPANNPAYIQLKAQFAATNSELQSLRHTREQIKAKVTAIETRLVQGPQVERDYRNLTRDYENALLKYKEVRAKQLEAELAESLERENKGERFSLIEPPQVPEEPAKPNRLAILFVGFVLAFVGGLGSIAITEALSESIKSPKRLLAVAGVTPMVVIPYIETEEDRNKGVRAVRLMILSLVLVGLVALVLTHFMVMPLEVVWHALMRKLGVEFS